MDKGIRGGRLISEKTDKLINQQMTEDINEILELVEAMAEMWGSHPVDYNNPHRVTKEQVGLGSVDNTSDMDKPVSNAAAEAINTVKEETQSATETLRLETHSAIETLRVETFSAIATLKEETQSAINTFKEENSAAHETITNELTTLIETETNNLTSRIDEIARRFQVPYITEGSMDDLTEEGTYLISQQVDGFPRELFDNGLYLFLGLLKVVKREIENARGIIQYIGASLVGIADTQTIYGARSWTEEDGWSEWGSDLYFLDISYTTMVSKETTLENAKSFVVTDEKGIKTIPVNKVTAGNHNHDDTYSKLNHTHTNIATIKDNTIINEDNWLDTAHRGMTVSYWQTAEFASKKLPTTAGALIINYFVSNLRAALALNFSPVNPELRIFNYTTFAWRRFAFEDEAVSRVTVTDGVTWIETPLSNGKSMLYGTALKSGSGDGLLSNMWKMVPPKSIDNATVKLTANSLASGGDGKPIYLEWKVFTYGDLTTGAYKNIMISKDEGTNSATEFLLTMQAMTK